MERPLRIASPLDLYAEKFDPDRMSPGELSAGVLPPRADRGCGAHGRPRTRAFL